MNKYFDYLIIKFGLEHLDSNPLLLRTQKCLQKISKDYGYHHRLKFTRPSYIFILLIMFAVLVTIIKIFQTAALIYVVLIRSYLTLKQITTKNQIKEELMSWLFFAFLLLFHQFLYRIDFISPLFQIFCYQIPWYDNHKYTMIIFEYLKSAFPESELFKISLKHQKTKQIEEDERLSQFTQEAQKQYRAFLRI